MEKIKEIKKVNLKNIPVIQSFSGSGAIGTIRINTSCRNN
jgi:hypothetical protein